MIYIRRGRIGGDVGKLARVYGWLAQLTPNLAAAYALGLGPASGRVLINKRNGMLKPFARIDLANGFGNRHWRWRRSLAARNNVKRITVLRRKCAFWYIGIDGAQGRL